MEKKVDLLKKIATKVWVADIVYCAMPFQKTKITEPLCFSDKEKHFQLLQRNRGMSISPPDPHSPNLPPKSTNRNSASAPRKWDTHLIRSSRCSDCRCGHSLATNWSLNSARQVKCKGSEDKNAKNAGELRWENRGVEQWLLCVDMAWTFPATVVVSQHWTKEFSQALMTTERRTAETCRVLFSLPNIIKLLEQFIIYFQIQKLSDATPVFVSPGQSTCLGFCYNKGKNRTPAGRKQSKDPDSPWWDFDC